MKLNLKASLCSMIGALAGAGIALLLKTLVFGNTVAMRIVWVGLFFALIALGGAIGLHLYLTFTQKYEVSRRPGWVIFLLVAILVTGGLGSGGQYLFMMDIEEHRDVEGCADIVMLLDCSGSMSTIEEGRASASATFIDYLNENIRLQVVPFGSTIFTYNTSALLEMNDANKDAQKALISSLVSAGRTDFEEPLEFAYDSLMDNEREDAAKVVVILSDAEGDIPKELAQKYEDSDIRVFSLRFDFNQGASTAVGDFIDFVERTDGFDIPIDADSQDGVDEIALEAAFETVFEASVDYVSSMNSNLLVCAEDSVSFWQHVIRFVTLALCSAAIGVGFFAQFDFKGLVFNVLIGLAGSGLVALFEGLFGLIFCCLLLSVLLGTAIVSLQEKQDTGGYFYNV